jgi:hypothetical protein
VLVQSLRRSPRRPWQRRPAGSGAAVTIVFVAVGMASPPPDPAAIRACLSPMLTAE